MMIIIIIVIIIIIKIIIRFIKIIATWHGGFIIP